MTNTNDPDTVPPWLAEARNIPRPVISTDSTTDLARGQIRVLRPLPDDHRTHGQHTLVLRSSFPSSMPDDISWNPGPCNITYIIPLYSEETTPTTFDVVLPTALTGLPYHLHAAPDLLTTVRLDPDDPQGRRRFGPHLGRTMTEAAIGYLHRAVDGKSDENAQPPLGLEHGIVAPQTGDHLWYWRSRECENMNRLGGWW